ncbi:protein transport protein SEC31 homolog B-like [Impatiens glandulifera]|uniref:protein transport protein SEC31 homolog B-like n=1 Tax=Impatiens glandulifera TaxID=253017 RepID=UPI001FB16E9E|nr:protein transport protein SEC31 homolog B-like [Impatiens glandulifera]
MACIKSVNRSASVAFAPEAPYLAAGTMAGAVDLSFSSSANLEIFKLDFQSDERELPLAGEAATSERFNRLSWGKNPGGAEEFSLGLIAGGLVDGSIGLWNPLTLISSEASESALVSQLSRHRGPVRGLEFNSLSPNHLASGADEGEICIWDITKPGEPTHFPPLKGSGSATQGEISFVSWNNKVQHILASTSYNGTIVVWDLKKQKPVISFSDSNRRRCSVLQWHPDVATQLVVASDDDNDPFLRLWDMRNTMSPVREFVGHTKGVIAMSWCPSDSSYLLSCAKDNRTICWDVVSGEIVSELPAGTNWNFDVHWYPKIPGVISASSFDGKIGIYNMEAYGRNGVGEGDFGAAPLRAPKWYKRKSGVSFGFGGKLVSFSSKDGPSGGSEVYVNNMVTEQSLASRSSEFEATVKEWDRSSLRLICDKKSQESESSDEKETWGFLRIISEDGGTARTKLLTHLGFTLPVEEKDNLQNDLSQEVTDLGTEEKVANLVGYKTDDHGASTLLTDNEEDFFNNLPSPKAETPVSTSGDKLNVGVSLTGGEEELQPEMDAEEDGSSDSSFDEAIQHALVVGDYKSAVVQCVSANKIADALVISHLGGSSLWESTRDQYLKMSRSPYLKIVSAMVSNDLTNLVSTRPLKSWKETLALLCSFAAKEEWTLLCSALASRLMTAGNILAATLCYICAGNIDKTVEIWSWNLSRELEGKSYVDLFQDLMEKTIVFVLATEQKQYSASLCKLVEKYAEILASQGLLSTAMGYLKLLGLEELSPELRVLQERIAMSIENDREIPKPVQPEYHPSQTPTGYGGVQSNFGAMNSSQYYQESVPSHMQSVQDNSYVNSYQQVPSASYGRGYGVPAPYQPVAQTPMFPSPALQESQMQFVPPPANNPPAVKTFNPAQPMTLRNADQYQQAPTLGSQLYPGTGFPNYTTGPSGDGSLGSIPSQSGPIQGHKMPPQVFTPGSAPRGFVPVANSGVQRPVMSQTQSSSPAQSAVVPPAAAPVAPIATVQTADTSKVPAHLRPVIATLTRLFNETSEVLGGPRAVPAKKREIEDNSRKIGALYEKLNRGDISKNAAEKLVHISQALDNGDFNTALQVQVQLTTSDWDECNFWLTALKRMIKTRQNVR